MKTKMGEYLCEFAPDHPRATKEGYVRTHILMAEKKIGRYLNPEECVHHIDENKYNNSLDNLMVFKTIADHSAFHKGVEAVCEGDVWYCPKKRIYHKELCTICGVNYKYAEADMCIECWNNLNNRFIKNTNIERPSREVLKEKIRTRSFLQVGKEYGVSDNAVRKWCKFYGLPFKSCDIKSLSDDEWNNEYFNNTK
jgi:hypothetical protein